MATASSSKPLRKSCLKRQSCYDDFGDKSASGASKPDSVKKQKQSTLQMRPSPFQRNEETTKEPSESKPSLLNTIEIEDDEIDEPVPATDTSTTEDLNSSKTVGQPTRTY